MDSKWATQIGGLLNDDELNKVVTEQMPVPPQYLGAIIGRKGCNVRLLQMMLGVKIECKPGNEAVSVSGPHVAVLVALHELEEATKNEEAVEIFMDKMRIMRWNKVHCFVDWSNILISACIQHMGSSPSMGLNVAALKKRVLAECDVTKLLVVGSTSSASKTEALTQAWKKEGFQTDFKTRTLWICRPAGVPESALHIDDRLIAAAANSLLATYSGKQKLVLLTGDGNDNGGPQFESFTALIQSALLKEQWTVELWCWERSVSRVCKKFQKEYPGKFSLCYLDPYRKELLTGLKVCKFHLTPQGCRYGSKCKFLHPQAEQPRPAAPRAPRQQNNPQPAPVQAQPRPNECPVCMDAFDVMYQFGCGHKICQPCGQQVMRTNGKCHICRCSVSTITPRFD